MERFYLKSVIAEISKRIEEKIESGFINKETRVFLYGLDRYSFAMRTILDNLGYKNVFGYISEDEKAVAETRVEINRFSGRYLRDTNEVINVYTLEEASDQMDEKSIILVVSKEYKSVKAVLENAGYKENADFVLIYDLVDEDVSRITKGLRKIELDEAKSVEKDILEYVDNFCMEKGLRYWVCGGTLLGTMRHEGFIPWDDDIDIFLPWEDFKRFIASFPKHEYFDLMGIGTSDENDLNNLCAKVVDKRTVVVENIGTVEIVYPVWIDVFPLIGLPKDEAERKGYFARYRELDKAIWQDFYKTNGDVGVFPKWYQKQLDFLSKYEFDSSEYVGVLGTAYGERDCTQRKVYGDTVRKKFEDIFVNVPIGYEEYLGNLYGNWRQLPSEDKRKSNHNIEMYWR